MTDKKSEKKSSLKLIVAFSGIGFQMLVTILLFAYIGHRLDEANAEGGNTWTLILTFTGLVIGLYFMIKGIMNLLKNS